MLQRSLGQAMLHTKFLIERDCLSASMARLGSGFTPDSVIREAKDHALKIQHLIDEIDRIRHFPKDSPVHVRFLSYVDEGCCPRK